MKLQKIGRHPEDLPETSSNRLMLLLSHHFDSAGRVVRWDYYRKTPLVPLYVSVWRSVEGTKYQLVDYNELVPGVIDFQAKEIEDDEQIEVKSGDIIGVFYSRYAISGAIAMATSKDDSSKDDNGNLTKVVMVDIWEEDLSPGDIIDLETTSHNYRNIDLALQANLRVAEKS